MASPAFSETEIANFALAHLGVSKPITNIVTERSKEAMACKLFYDISRNEMMREFPWPFSTRFVDLALVGTAPTTEWGYSYRYPSDCACLRRIMSGNRNDSVDSRIPYRLGNDTNGELIFTDMADASVEYTHNITDPLLFSADFIAALSLRLAAYIAPQLTSGDPFKIGPRAERFYMLSIAKAQSSAVNEEQRDRTPESEFILGR